MTDTMTPTWSIDSIDEDIRTDLAAAGLTIGDPAQADQAQRDALAGILMRAMAEDAKELAALRNAHLRELDILAARFERLMGPIHDRVARNEAHVKLLASVSDFGKRKSRDVGYGAYGSKLQPARLEIADQAACVHALSGHAPDLVRCTLKLPLRLAQALVDDERISREQFDASKLDVLNADVKAHFLETGELPAGCSWREAEEVHYCKPEPIQ